MSSPRPEGDRLRSLASQRLSEGRLPTAATETRACGYGSGHSTCALCDGRIMSDEVEYRLVNPRDGREVALHLGCRFVWLSECSER
jgi:hypothetical protein